MKCIDTTFIIDLLRGNKNAIKKAIDLELEDKVITTEVCVYEIYYGIFYRKGKNIKDYIKKLNKFLDKLEVLPLDRKSSIMAAKIASELTKKGLEIGSHDCMIAAIALTNGCNIIITDNIEHFKRIKELKTETY